MDRLYKDNWMSGSCLRTFITKHVKIDIIEETILYGWYIRIIYYFYVPCLFLCKWVLALK